MLSERREQQAAVTFIAITRITSAALLGTVMAVYIGEIASEFYVSLALAVFHFGLLFAAPFWGAVADVTGRRRAVLFGTLVLSGAALLPLAFTQSLWAQLGARGLYSVFAAGFGPTMLAIVSNRGGEEERGRSVGFYNSALSVGDISGRLASGYVLGFLLPGETYLLVAVLGAVAALGVIVLTDPTPTPEEKPALGELLSEVRSRLLPEVGDRAHLRTNGLQYLYVALALRNMTQKGMSSILPVFLITGLGVSEPMMGALLAVSPTVRTGAMYALGRVSDRVGRKPLITAGLVGAAGRWRIRGVRCVFGRVLGARAGGSTAGQAAEERADAAVGVAAVDVDGQHRRGRAREHDESDDQQHRGEPARPVRAGCRRDRGGGRRRGG